MTPGPDDDLLIIASERADFFDVVQRFRDTASVEVRLDRRRGERRRAPQSPTSEERRRHDRRELDVSEQLRTVGWVFIPGSQRS